MDSTSYVRTLTDEALEEALFKNIMWQQKWSRKLEKIMYFGEDAPAMFITLGVEIIQAHQDKITMIEQELERRGRVKFFNNLVEKIDSYAALQ